MSETVTLNPTLKALASEFQRRCEAIAATVATSKGLVAAEVVQQLRNLYLAPIPRPTKAELDEELHLIASISVVIDLIGQGWTFRELSSGVSLEFERSGSVDLEKERIRRAHLLDRDTQLTESSVVQFIRGMEKRRLTPQGWHSIFSVMRDGELLASQLKECLSETASGGEEDCLECCISPYLQFVTPDAVCEHTGLRLNDIWRYFRHTWVNSYRSVPGRSMMVLVRDAAGPNHPVIAIAALGSSVVQSSVRDSWIGWDAQGTLKRLEVLGRKKAAEWIQSWTDQLIQDIYIRDLLREGVISKSEIRKPTAQTLLRLEEESAKAIKQHRLYPLAAKQNEGIVLNSREWKQRAETSLFRSKRAKHLARLLKIRTTFDSYRMSHTITKAEWEIALQSAQFRSAIGQLIRAVKAERVGINMMDITVCGAVAPYNHLLGGKLMCMLLCSPELSRECARRYGNHVSIIASAMRGRPVQREASLALLCTTSLYGAALSQYSRVKIPAEVAGGRMGSKVEYRELGVSEGFGSFHFSKESLRLFGMVLGRSQHARKVNSIFGEGVNPLMRKIRDAMGLLGLPAEALIRHGNRRVVYGVSLASNSSEFLSGFNESLRYTFPQTKVKERSREIAHYWSKRWLKSRIERPEILQQVASHKLTYPVRHGGRVNLPNDTMLMDAVMLPLEGI